MYRAWYHLIFITFILMQIVEDFLGSKLDSFHNSPIKAFTALTDTSILTPMDDPHRVILSYHQKTKASYRLMPPA